MEDCSWYTLVMQCVELIGDAVCAETKEQQSAVLAQMDRIKYAAHIKHATENR